MTDPAAGLSILHVIVRAGPTNSQYNEHCLPTAGSRRLTVASLFPADVQPPSNITMYQGDGTLRGCFRTMRRALAAERYDVVHVHAAASAMITLVTYLRMRRPLRNLLFTMHNSWRNFSPRNRLFLRIIIALFPVVVVCGHAAYESLPSRIRRLYGGKLTVVPNGVDLDRVDRSLRQEVEGQRTQPAGRTLVCVNRLIKLKDPDTLLNAFTMVGRPQDRLVFIGDGPLRSDLRQRSAQAGLAEQVELTGIVPRDEVYYRLGRADAFVSTSRGEGLPVALLEAMACGVPVVVSDIPPHREVAQRAGGFPLVPPGDAKAFARAVSDVVALPPVERAAMVGRLRRCVADHYSVTVMNEAYGSVYRRMAKVYRTSGGVADLTSSGRGAGLLIAKLRQRLGLLVLLTVVGGAVGFVVASVQSPVFKGQTTLQVGQTLGVGVDEPAMKTSTALAVRYTDLVRREPVLGPVADDGFARSWKQLQGDVFAQLGDKNPQLVQISVYAGNEQEAGRLARAVAASLQRTAREALASDESGFLTKQLDAQQAEIRATMQVLESRQAALSSASPQRRQVLRGRIEETRTSLDQQRSTYAELSSMDSTTVGSLTLVDEAWTTRSPLRPAPLVLGIAGAAAGATLAAGWAQLFGRPRTTPEVDHSVVGTPPALEAPATSNGRTRTPAWAPDV